MLKSREAGYSLSQYIHPSVCSLQPPGEVGSPLFKFNAINVTKARKGGGGALSSRTQLSKGSSYPGLEIGCILHAKRDALAQIKCFCEASVQSCKG